MLDHYGNQSLSLKRKSGISASNKPTFDATVIIAARLQYKSVMTHDSQGQEVLSDSQMFTMSEVAPGDVVVIDGRDRSIISVETLVGLDGGVAWYKGYV